MIGEGGYTMEGVTLARTTFENLGKQLPLFAKDSNLNADGTMRIPSYVAGKIVARRAAQQTSHLFNRCLIDHGSQVIAFLRTG